MIIFCNKCETILIFVKLKLQYYEVHIFVQLGTIKKTHLGNR